MKNSVFIVLIMLLSFVILWFFQQEPVMNDSTQIDNEKILKAIKKINNNVNKLSNRIDHVFVEVKGHADAKTDQNISANESVEQKALLDDYIEITDFDSVIDASLPRGVDSLKDRPPMVMVNPTLEQNEVFQMLKARLDDPTYLSTLSLLELSQAEDLVKLPKALQLVLISKAIKQYNNGAVSKEVFYANQL